MRLSSGALRTNVKIVVTAQLKALQARDFDAAYTYAARGIKAQFDRPLFAALMERGYAPLLQHQTVDIGVVRDDGAGLAQVTITVIDPRQRRTTYRYALVQETLIGGLQVSCWRSRLRSVILSRFAGAGGS